MTGVKRNPDKKYNSSWGGARKGAGRKLKTTSEFSEIYSHLREKYKLEPIETHFKILSDLEDETDAMSIKLKQISVNSLMAKRYPNPTEMFEDEDGNSYFPGSVEEADKEIAMLMADLGLSKEE